MAKITVHRAPLSFKGGLRPIVVAPVLGALIFLALPWPLEHKAHHILHGLCAQRPSHTYYFGDRPLPFDARMTGIYLGFVATMAVLFASGAHRWCRPPSPTRIAALLFIGGAMVIDGSNSLLRDLALPHPYDPLNWLRVVTGAGAGLVLAVALCFLLSVTLWSAVDTGKQTLNSWGLFGRAVTLATPLLLIAMLGIGPLYAPLVVLLIFSALAVLTTLALIVIVILRRLEYRFATGWQVEPVLAPALAVALVIMLALAAGRYILERWIDSPTLT